MGEGLAGSPSNSVAWAEATSMPSFVLIHTTVWPEYTNVIDSMQTGQTGQLSVIIRRTVFERPFVKRFALCYRSVVLSVCDVRALWPNGWTDGRIKMKLGVQVGLSPGHIVLGGPGGDPAPPPLKGHSPPIFGPYQLRPNGCMDHDVTWYGGRPRHRRLCVRWGPCYPP